MVRLCHARGCSRLLSGIFIIRFLFIFQSTILLLKDAQGCSRMLSSARFSTDSLIDCSDALRFFEIPSAFMGVFRILDDALGCFGILAASMDVFRGLGDAEGCSEMLRDAQRCFGVQDSPQILRLIPAML